MSFAVVGGTFVDAPKTVANEDYSLYGYIDDVVTTQSEWEYKSYRVGVIGRHEMVQLGAVEHLGPKGLVEYTDYMNGAMLKSFGISDTYSIITTETISMTEKIDIDLAGNIGAKILVDGVTLQIGKSFNIGYEINKTVTYTTTETQQRVISYEVDPQWFIGQLAIGRAADTYKIHCETWAWDDYWWGDYEVSGSRKSFDIYVTDTPVTTVLYKDGGVLWFDEIVYATDVKH